MGHDEISPQMIDKVRAGTKLRHTHYQVTRLSLPKTSSDHPGLCKVAKCTIYEKLGSVLTFK